MDIKKKSARKKVPLRNYSGKKIPGKKYSKNKKFDIILRTIKLR